jgi:hypothetical protein
MTPAGDTDIDFDPARLTLTGFTLANGLGDVSSREALDFGQGLVVPGLLNLAVKARSALMT